MSTASPSIAFWTSIHRALKRSGAKLALGAAGVVDAVLEAVHRDLAEGGRNGVLEASDEQLEAAARVRLRLEAGAGT